MTRAVVALVAATAALSGFGVQAALQSSAPRDDRPNIVVVLTDDQTFDSLPHRPAVMPYLQRQIEDPASGWTWFPNAFVNTPLCCPSRATILTGRYSHNTGVEANDEGDDLDESSTIATWLHDAGYRTAVVGKYLNGYPFGRGPYVPPGWDHFVGKENTSDATVYRSYRVVDDGVVRAYGGAPEDYATSVLARDAAAFIRSSPPGRPFFLLFAPSAPHRPWVPPPGAAGAFDDMPIRDSPAVGERDVSDKPAWVRALPRIPATERAALRDDRRREYETLLGVDEAMRSIDDALRARGELDRTIVIYLTDNGYSLGEHRWKTKSCPYEPCVRIPLFVRMPDGGPDGAVDRQLVSNVDLASTIADFGGVRPELPQDGVSFAPLLRPGAPPAEAADAPTTSLRRRGVLLEFAGGGGVPAWDAVRTKRLVWVDLATGEHELYDIGGVAGPPDPDELDNRAAEPAYASIRRRLEALLRGLRER